MVPEAMDIDTEIDGSQEQKVHYQSFLTLNQNPIPLSYLSRGAPNPLKPLIMPLHAVLYYERQRIAGRVLRLKFSIS